MTTLVTKYDPFFVGFKGLFNQLDEFQNSKQKYPPYNIIQEDDNTYIVEIAVAGFSKDEISVTHHPGESNELQIIGEKIQSDVQSKYLHRGIANRKFEKSLTLSNTILVTSARIVDGILNIKLEDKIPESEKPKSIKIN